LCEVDAGEFFSSRDVEGDAVCSPAVAKQRTVWDWQEGHLKPVLLHLESRQHSENLC